MTETERAPDEQVVLQIPIRWSRADDLPTLYANQLFVSHAGPEFYLVFGNIVPPLIVSEAERDTLPEYLEVQPVAKIAVTREQMIEFTKTINENVERFLRKQRLAGDGEEEME